MNPYLVYLSGPITGLTFDGASDWRKDTNVRLYNKSDGCILTLSPMRGKRYLNDGKPIGVQNGERGIISTDEAIFTRDRNDVKRSSAMLVNLLGATKISIGTVIEMVWASEYKVPTVVAIEPGNVHLHPILNVVQPLHVDTLEKAELFVYNLLKDDTWDKEDNDLFL